MARGRAQNGNYALTWGGKGGTSSSSWSSSELNRMLLVGVWTLVVFYAGVLTGMHAAGGGDTDNSRCRLLEKNQLEAMTHSRVQQELDRLRGGSMAAERRTLNDEAASVKAGKSDDGRFPSSMNRFAVGMARTPKTDFLRMYDYGIPPANNDGYSSGTADVLLLYSARGALPNGPLAESATAPNKGIPLLDAADATANCDAINVMTTRPMGGSDTMRQCTAIVGQYESYHLQRWMRIELDKPRKRGDPAPKLDRNQPLVHVGRGMQPNGVNQFVPPKRKHMDRHWVLLRNYLNSVEEVKGVLQPILQKIAVDNVIVVMVCNFGQSELLMNFVCTAKARNLNIKNVLLFATDQKTYDIAIALGITAFYDKSNFESLPSEEAKRYGDQTFVAMMYAKVVTVQLVNLLGYDVLFQDVDVVWYRNPVEVFNSANKELAHFDILFQDDGARSLRYAPFSANSGFYYVRNNDRTQYLFTALLYSGDLIMSTDSHQQTLTALLNEHASLFGLRVKTLAGEEFPGGYHYHRAHDLLMNIVSHKREPWLFHMSWTNNKDNKVLFFQQMGLWHLSETCDGGKSVDVLEKKESKEYVQTCCLPEPRVVCHYRDKPSAIPCKDSPPIDANGKSFW